jgi:V8-like Glu-specific endopeptidase
MYIYDHTFSASYQQTHDGLGAVIGGGARQRVRDSDKAPYRWICALDLYFPPPPGGTVQLQRGTGLLISSRHVLTAAHNVLVHDDRDPNNIKKIRALRITVHPGLDGTKVLGKQRAPAGAIELTPGDWWVPPQFDPKGDLAWDFALLTLPKDLPPVHGMTYGYWGDARYAPRTKIVAVKPSELVGQPVLLSGYPADKCKKDSCAPCVKAQVTSTFNWDLVRDKKGWASTQWEAGGSVQPSPAPGLILHDADACAGMSGSPIWQENKGDLELVAVHTGGPVVNINIQFNRGIPLVAQLLDLLRQRMLSDGERAKF